MHAQSCPTLCAPMDYRHTRLLYGTAQARILKWVSISSSRGSSQSRIKPTSPALQADSLPLSHLGSPFCCISSVQSLSRVQLFVTPWTVACQASLSITNSQRLLKLMSIESVMPSSHLIPCCPLLLLLSIFPSIRVFSSKSALHIKRPKHWSFSFSFSINPSNEYSGLIFFRSDCCICFIQFSPV